MASIERIDAEDNSLTVTLPTAERLIPALKKFKFKQDVENIEYWIERMGKGGHPDSTMDLNIEDWSLPLLQEVLPIFESRTSIYSYFRRKIKINSNPKTARVRKLQLLPEALSLLLTDGDVIDGWVYKTDPDGGVIAYVVERIKFIPPDKYTQARVVMNLVANRAEFSGEDEERRVEYITEESVTWHYGDIVDKTADQCILEKNLLRETPELKAQYVKDLKAFTDILDKSHAQYWVTGVVTDADNEKRGWWREERKFKCDSPVRMINDESILDRRTKMTGDDSFWHKYSLKSAFKTIPVHPFILMYDLMRHLHVWAHAARCEKYVYNPELKDKLVLPDMHRDLIDVLTADMDVFQEDIVKGKSGGTGILCHGMPGLGKTLTAEVYSEVVQRPLYRVQAGQLGTDVEKVEEQLDRILRRSTRWGAVLLIDEADVYIRRRSDDINHNAIVAVFLRTLEYFSGLLFMTTNRIDDVDDAIASRMIALFRYEVPDAKVSAQLWKVLAAQYNVALSDKAIAQLVETFPGTCGRDIKQLLRLVTKYTRKRQEKLSLDVFRKCAMFRGL